jgi:hypothetical protein
MANLSRDQMREYQRARRARLKGSTPAHVIKREDFDARASAIVPTSHSMVAVGGKPGRGLVPQARGYGLPPDLAAVSTYTRAEEFRAHTTTLLAALAAKSDEHARRLVALEIAAADRRAEARSVVHTLGGIFKFALTGRG